MSEAVIQIEGIGKRYRVGERERYLALRDVLARAMKAPFGGVNGAGKKRDYLWALKDVSFDVKQGEVVGLIGRNGAGKSTLLKILARVTKPTEGWAEVRGRVGSLLEVGTGFHPELTGRENVFLSGAILGMKRAEILRKFDEIVAFAEVERFLDTPLKHYSSGMQMRLAFAVAAHLEPEILLVDEVLAVGDIEFQKKCLGKMGDVARSGRTIVFVSHQMNQIRRLCERVFWLDHGQIRAEGKAVEVVSGYEAATSSGAVKRSNPSEGSASAARFLGWEITQRGGESPHTLNTFGEVAVRFFLSVDKPIQHAVHGVTLYTAERQIVWGWAAYELELAPGMREFRYEFPMLPLKPGLYTWMVSLWDDHGMVDMTDVSPEMLVSTESQQHPRDEWCGLLNLPSRFEVREAEPHESNAAGF